MSNGNAKLYTPFSTRRTKTILCQAAHPRIFGVPSPRMHRRYLHNLCGKHLQSTEAPRDYSPKKIIHYLLSEQQMKEIFVFQMKQNTSCK